MGRGGRNGGGQKPPQNIPFKIALLFDLCKCFASPENKSKLIQVGKKNPKT